MSILCSTADVVNSGCWFFMLKALTLNVAMFIMFLHISKLGLSFGYVSDFSNTGDRAPTAAERAPCLPA